MATLSWNEIKDRAASFVNEWQEKTRDFNERAEAQTFENAFFGIFGVPRAKVDAFEKRVNLNKDGFDAATDLPDGTPGQDRRGYIDLFWKGHIIIEMKAPGEDLQKAFEQAKSYAQTLSARDLPKVILACDFYTFAYYDMQHDAKLTQFPLADLVEHIELFGFLAGYTTVEYKKLDPVNIEAAELMGRLHDSLKDVGYSGHDLEVYLVRLLFCLFADNTGIFEHNHFLKYIIERTNPDGSDIALHIGMIFEILNEPKEKRLKNIDEQLSLFPYIDGGLFAEHLKTASFDSAMRERLIDCFRLDWSKISPAIFGAMFQSILDETARHDVGAHYTSEENILKVIHPLFLDDLRSEFEGIKALKSDVRIARLNQFHDKLSGLKFLDPACGCGNFLVISYREIRLLELEVIRELLGKERILDVDQYIKVNVNQFYGIEIVEFPAKVAQTAMWLMDHLMNMQVREQFGQYYVRIPLTTSASIHNVNALPLDWESIVPKAELSYILGNPPFLGSRVMDKGQKTDLLTIFDGVKNCGELDYVTCWYKKAAEYIQGTKIECAFVSTNSICQGLQVSILWQEMIFKYGIRINFAHQTFKWWNEARGKAAVYCIILGFSLNERMNKQLFLYENAKGDAKEIKAKNINAYLSDAPNTFIDNRSNPICPVPQMNFGNMPADGGKLLFSTEEKDAFLKAEPDAAPWIKRFISAHEFINNGQRWCLWLVGIEPGELRRLKLVYARVKEVKSIREASARPQLAAIPHLFAQITQPAGQNFILIPRVSSENRKYIPIGFFDKNHIASDTCMIIPNGTIYHFGVLTSTMHMAWMRQVCGRLESRYRYSKDIVYNNFPWHLEATEKQKAAIEEKAQAVLDARALFPTSSLADLYDPLTMPPELTKAHQKLDKAVEKAYGRIFADDAERLAYLFELYQQKCGELFAETKRRGKGRKV